MNSLQRSIMISSEDLQSANLHDETFIEIQEGWISLTELIDATQNFSPEMEIGRGCIGITYKAELQNSQAVAVKKLYTELEQGIDLTRDEIESMKSLNHENVRQLLDFYSSENLTFLVYEYMEKGSLQKVLHDVDTLLNWETRFKICLGIAKGLDYLHSKSVVHGNIKSSTILLDQSFNPKISNTGLVKDTRRDNQNMLTQTSVLKESHMESDHITEKSDVYSYGLLLLEIVSAKEYEGTGDPVSLLDKALELQAEGRLLELVDGRLSNYDREQAINVLKLGIFCTDQPLNFRPGMTDIIMILKGGKTIDQISEANTTISA